MEDIALIIPSLNPDEKILDKFLESVKKDFKTIVVIDDGSDNKYRKYYEKIEKEGFIVLRHHVNLGKGRAIKTGFNYILNNHKEIIGVITADSDGQHCAKDILNMAKKLKEDPKKLVLGIRDFNEEQVPWTSRNGNKITRAVFSIFVGLKVSDTQTGLRAFGRETMKKFLPIAGERYEYETNMLIESKAQNIEIVEVPISTIYIENNSLSHFNFLLDSIMIYKLFIKYIISSLSSFVVDLLLFTVYVNVFAVFKFEQTAQIFLATIIARVVSSLLNYSINSKVVFKSKDKSSIIKYFTLVIAQMLVSACFVSIFVNMIPINSTVTKMLVDIVIFIVNFTIQREWVFKDNK